MDPAIRQALAQTQEALRAEQRALEELPRERTWLRERLGQLEAEQGSLHHQLETLRQGQPREAPRLPDRLPFEVRPRQGRGRYFYWRRTLAVTLATGLLVHLTRQSIANLSAGLLPLLVVLLLVLLIKRSFKGPPSWFFTEHSIGLPWSGLQRPRLSYSEVLEAEAHVSAAQRHRGVGTVVVLCKPTREHPAGKSFVLKNVPEPERLAEWIRWKRTP